MLREDNHIELAIGYRNRPSRVARLLGRSATGHFQKELHTYLERREILPDGTRQEVHHLPDADETYEVEEVRDGKRITWYGATLKGDAHVHPISRYGAEMVAKMQVSIRMAIHEFPEMPAIEIEE